MERTQIEEAAPTGLARFAWTLVALCVLWLLGFLIVLMWRLL